MSSNDFPKRVVAVDGATGYLGTHLIAALQAHCVPVRALVHPGASSPDTEWLRSRCTVNAVDMHNCNDDLVVALQGVHTAVHLIGSIAPRKNEPLQSVHVQQTRSFCEAAKRAKVRKIVHVTALGTKADALSDYHRTKWQAEQIVRDSGIECVFIRPSLIVGKGHGRRNSKLIDRYFKLIRTRPLVPVVGNGANRLQPVFVGDVTAAIVKAIVSDLPTGTILEIGGDEICSMSELISLMMSKIGMQKSLLNVPIPVAFAVARLLESFQTVPLLSQDQVKLSSEDNICSQNALHALGISPRTLNECFETYSEIASGYTREHQVT